MFVGLGGIQQLASFLGTHLPGHWLGSRLSRERRAAGWRLGLPTWRRLSRLSLRWRLTARLSLALWWRLSLRLTRILRWRLAA